MKKGKTAMDRVYRWSDSNGGGIVIARDSIEAKEKLIKYGREECEIWSWVDDDYYDETNPDVMDIY